MKKILMIFMCYLLGISGAFAQSGAWSGNLEVMGTELPLVFHLDEEAPTLDSPAQGAKGIPIQFSIVEPDSIAINIPAVGATFNGKYKNNEIAGTFIQRGMSFPLVLTQGEKGLKRPQTPRPPYPYMQEAVSFTNGDAVLKGTLTLPEGCNIETPVVMMVTGSGLQNRDEEIFDHKPFAVIADALARNGIASLRYDDRGFGESTGDAVNCTTEDLMLDALSGIDVLRQRFNKVGVLGHSEGGTIALMSGAQDKVDFIVSLAGMAISGKELLLDQNHYILSQAGYSKEVEDEYCSLVSSAFEGDREIVQKIETSTLPPELKNNLQKGLKQLESPYMQYFLASDISDQLGKIKCPVLALNGKKDTQVFYEKNLEVLKKGLPANKNNRLEALDDLNHLFQHCKTGSINEYATIEETLSPEVLTIICEWIKTQ